MDARGGAPAAAGTVACLPVGPFQANCYLVDDGAGGCAVIDPGADAAAILAALGGRHVSCVLATHGHFDHVGAVDGLAARCDRGWAIGAADAAVLGDLVGASRAFGLAVQVETAPSRTLADGDTVRAGGLCLLCVACPGHTPGGMAYLDEAHGLLFTGDTLFAGSVGRTDLPSGDAPALDATLARLAALPGNARVLPGHGPATTLARERAENPYLVRAARGR